MRRYGMTDLVDYGVDATGSNWSFDPARPVEQVLPTWQNPAGDPDGYVDPYVSPGTPSDWRPPTSPMLFIGVGLLAYGLWLALK